MLGGPGEARGHGPTSGVWAATLTPGVVDASDLGVRHRGKIVGPAALKTVDHVTMTVH